jgi:two-component system, NarL family, invasion response regulator UvrY
MKILVVDDHPIVRTGLRRLLALEKLTDIREATSGNEALSVFKEHRPDLIILDLNLPGVGGLEILRRLKAEESAARVLVLVVHDDPIYAVRALPAGAAGYVSKQAPPDQIVEAIKRVSGGENYVEHNLAQELARPPAHPLTDLSRRDLEILRLLGDGRSLPKIAETIGISYKTVANNCSHIKAKLGVAELRILSGLPYCMGSARVVPNLRRLLPNSPIGRSRRCHVGK